MAGRRAGHTHWFGFLTVLFVMLNLGCSPKVVARGIGSDAEPSVWAADFMRTKPGQRERYLRYLDANWARSRRTVLAQGGIRSFQVLLTDPTAAEPWDVILLTEYKSAADYARAEEVFRPVMDAQGHTLIDGMSGRGPDNELKTTVKSLVFTSPIFGKIP